MLDARHALPDIRAAAAAASRIALVDPTVAVVVA
jgi:hypothetical protein